MGKRWRKAWLLIAGVLTTSLALAQVDRLEPDARQPAKARLVLVGSGFFPQGKLALYRQLAVAEGVQLDYVRAPLQPEAIASLAGADLVLAELPPVQMYRDEKLPGQLAPLPRALMVERDDQRGHGLDQAQITLLAAYARNGGERNLRALLHYLRQWQHSGKPPATPEPALVMPRTGIYHPGYRDLAFASLEDYLQWLGPKVRPGQPVIGIAMFASAIGSDSTAHIDALVVEVEQRGGIAVPFFRDTDGGVPVQTLLMRGGLPFVDVVANFEILYRGDIGNDYARLGVPVLQAITYWDGPEAAWRADRQGVSPGATSFYLAIPEQAGFIDPLIVAAAKSRTPPQPIAAQIHSLAEKAFNYAALRHTPAAEKKIGIVFYNYPPGEKNLGASGLNLPHSLHTTLVALRQAGYGADLPDEPALLDTLQRLLAPSYRGAGQLDDLLREDLAAWLPLRDYQRWFDALPAEVRANITAAWGAPAANPWLRQHNGEPGFAIPRLRLRNVTLMPQPSRASPDESSTSSAYHDVGRPVDHAYLAAYLYLREQAGRDAIVHFGTHGTQEWSYGKERGLSVYDNPMLLVGNVPVVYPYIVDDVGEALQAKRRGRAVIVSHQTPAFGAAGLHGDPLRMHQLIEEYQQLDHGAVRDTAGRQLRELAARSGVAADLQWPPARIDGDFDGFLAALHEYLDEIGGQAQPQGLHSFGESVNATRRGDTVRLMLARKMAQALQLDAEHPATSTDYRQLANEPGRAWLQRHLYEQQPLPATATPAQRELLEAARRADASLDAGSEITGLLDALAGRYSTPGLGGDPLRTPESLPTGRNLYGFDPLRVPSRAAWEAGQVALQQLIDSYRTQHQGRTPDKLAFSLWGVETMRHNGILESQVFAALGVRPVWDDGGRIDKVELIPAQELGRPRIDVVLSATGLYRDQFGALMQRMNEALALVEAADGGDNPIARHTAAVRARLLAAGASAEVADRYARTRIFSSAQGRYGSGLGGNVLRTDAWDSDSTLAQSYLAQMQYGYGPDGKHWGEIPEGVNAYAEQLRGTQAAVLSRSSNLYGMLTTDDPFSYLGGLSLAVRHLDGAAPALYISNLRDPAGSRVDDAARFLAAELQTRQFHPGWIKQMQQEGYAGTLEVVASMDNFWGWQAVDPGMVRDDQWQNFHDVYVSDSLDLGMRDWFERSNPQALAQIVERMLEAHRKGYWKADDATLRSLVQTWNELDARHDLLPGSAKLRPHIAQLAGAFGLNPKPAHSAPATPSTPPAPSASTAAKTNTASPSSQPVKASQKVRGMQLQRVQPPAPADLSRLWLALLPALLAFALGGWRQSRAA